MQKGLPLILFLISLTSICDTINQLFLKSAINSLTIPSPITIPRIIKFIFKLLHTPRLWLSFLFSTLSLCFWLFILSRADLSFAFAADSMHYVFIAVASYFILKEKVGPKRWIGTILITIGIALISLS